MKFLILQSNCENYFYTFFISLSLFPSEGNHGKEKSRVGNIVVPSTHDMYL